MINQFQDFNEELEQNFKDSLQKIQNPKSISAAFSITQSLLKNLFSQLDNHTLVIHDEQKPFKLQSKDNNTPLKQAQIAARKLQQIMDKKQQMKKQLERLKRQESLAKIQQNHFRQNKSLGKPFKSEITKQQIEKLKQLKTSLLNFQQQLKRKNYAYQEKLKKYKQQEKQLLEKQKQVRAHQRKQETQKNIQILMKRQQQRKAKLEQERKNINQIKNKKKLYQDMNEKWRNQQLQNQKKKLQQIEEKKKLQSVNFQSIKQHSKKYQQIIKKQKEERVRKQQQYSELFDRKVQTHPYGPSKFLTTVVEQQNKRRQQSEQRKKLAKVQTEKKLAYAQNIRLNFKPKVKRHQEEITDKKQLKDIRSISAFQIIQKGNSYMKEVHANIVPIKQQLHIPVIQQKTIAKYKDYLRESRMGRTSNSQLKSNQINEIKKIFKNENETKQQKFLKAKIIASRIAQKGGSKEKNLVQSINAKIQILKQITE